MNMLESNTTLYVKINTKNVVLWKQFVKAYFFSKLNIHNILN